MNSNEKVMVARLADHYEDNGVDDPLDTATHDFQKLKKDAPKLWKLLYESKLSDRQLGDWIFMFVIRWSKSGMSFKNFSANELDRIGSSQIKPVKP